MKPNTPRKFNPPTITAPFRLTNEPDPEPLHCQKCGGNGWHKTRKCRSCNGSGYHKKIYQRKV